MNGGAVLTRAAPPKETSILLVLIRFVEPGAFAVTIRVADPEPVAAHLNDTPAVPAKAFPAHLFAFDLRVVDPAEYKEISKFLPRQIVFWSGALRQPHDFVFPLLRLLEKTETVLPQMHPANPLCLAAGDRFVPTQHRQMPENLACEVTRLFDGWCLRQPQDRVPFGSRSLVEETTV